MSLFKRVLIANRGEMARRIIKTCDRLGIETVAVYSDADRDALFVKEATEAIHIGESHAVRSYLDMDKILQAAKESGADAIHPGYGFLAENATFIGRCEEEGIKFIGPTADVVTLMGSKVRSREEMAKAGIPVVPGSENNLESLEEAFELANEIGYPLMLKASAGGGGIGMRIVKSDSELKTAFPQIKQLAQNFFSDDSVFLEKLILNPRHIEVQVAADEHGNVVHLFDRECSVQRRHQKVVEEAPSPYLNSEVRERLYAAAIAGAKHIGYTNVGTMEFIFDGDKNFYFLEMNTRLQVEHPITEEITGVDLVEWQLKIAAGEPLPLAQEAIKMAGHAFECRIYAEDPANNYMPSPGEITELTLPEEARLDFGVAKGCVVSPFYDPMIGKIIVKGDNRQEALKETIAAIDKTHLEGIKTNRDLLVAILADEDFQKGEYTTDFLNQLKF